jgi:endonuclease/exonuclease/phosphatase (EEP) superfamily protein YafD
MPRDREPALAVAARALAVVPIALTLLPLARTGRGWVRIWDFPRLQISTFGVLAQTALWRWGTAGAADRALSAVLAACLLYQSARVLPYSPLYRREVPGAGGVEAGRCLRIFMANVEQENRRSDLVLDAVRSASADVVCLLETDHWWDRETASLAEEYRWSSRCPIGNHYGMLLYSRLPLASCDLRFAVSSDVPSIRAVVQLPSGDEVALYVVHPPPPLPDGDSYGRDAELVRTGLEIRRGRRPSIVVGDLNDVAWSYTTTLFKRVSRMVDPRVGRGLFSTFHARQPLARYPLDHVFHTRDFTLRELRRLAYTGSDHFPIVVELAFTPERKDRVAEPARPTRADLDEAADILQDAGQAASSHG